MTNQGFEEFDVPNSSPNFRTELADKLAELAPEIIADGKLDINKLADLLNKDADSSPERFGLSWPGKREAQHLAQMPTTATLLPDRDNSVDWETTQNVFIEGDNLEVLKVLQKHYYGKIKMIYIDPPYNTGTDFVYKDDFRDSVANYLQWTEQMMRGGKLTSNVETAGRYHSNWLNMMYPRLKLARNLLTEDGVIFISIDDHEAAHLAQIGNEIFGYENSLTSDCTGPFIWPKSGATAGHVVRNHEYIFGWARNKSNLNYFKLSDYGANSIIEDRAIKKISPKNSASAVTLKKGMRFEGENAEFSGVIGTKETMKIHGTLKFRDGLLAEDVELTAGWAMKEQLESWLAGNETFDTKGQKVTEFFFNKSGLLRYSKERGTFHPRTLLNKELVGTTKSASSEIEAVTGKPNPFEYAKPTDLIGYFISFCTSNDDVILDFFAGSGSTGHAVIKQNLKDEQKRRFICVQLPELAAPGSMLETIGFNDIADYARFRIFKADEKLTQNENSASTNISGFRAYKLADTNFAKWKVNATIDENELEDLFNSVRDSANDASSPEELFTETILKLGLSLTEQYEQKELAGLTVFSVGNDLILGYFDEQTKPNLDQLRELVELAEVRLIVLEDAFQGDDELKTNLVQLCKTRGIDLSIA
ncbi:site-specific DNA-methyltransferase [Rothia sp. LK2492]|uniref:site-specific DNA-methyltransferase n=1 Tax=Rothia sp. LK2492 TaxID=3114370 RepID=UPI0034CEBACD